MIKKRDGTLEMVQVVWDFSDSNVIERETRALRQAEKELGIPERIIDSTIYLRT